MNEEITKAPTSRWPYYRSRAEIAHLREEISRGYIDKAVSGDHIAMISLESAEKRDARFDKLAATAVALTDAHLKKLYPAFYEKPEAQNPS